MDKVLEIFQSPKSGKLSSSRVLSVFIVLLVSFTWLGFSLKDGHMTEIPPQVVLLVGTVIAGKVVQGMGESISDSNKKGS